jgi:hypothetical protein
MQDIRELFVQLRVEQFLVYLSDKGWNSAAEQRGDRARFELPDGEDPYVLLLPRSNRTRNCRDLLQKAVFILSGIEDRQPFAIATDLLAAEPASDPKPAKSGKIRLRMRNLHDTPLSIRISDRSSAKYLLPGEAVEILCQSDENETLELDIHGDS